MRRALALELNAVGVVDQVVKDSVGDGGVADEDGIAFTRCRPYCKNEQAFVEQKNGAVIRRLDGYRRLEGLVATAAVSQFCPAARLFVNFLQPSFKPAEKSRKDAKVHTRYHAPVTLYQRLPIDQRTPEDAKVRLRDTYVRLDPVTVKAELGVSENRSCHVLGQHRSTQRKPSHTPDN